MVASYEPRETNNDPQSFYNAVPVGHQITIKGDFAEHFGPIYTFDVVNIKNFHNSCDASSPGIGQPASCSFKMPSDGAVVEVNFRYAR